MTLGHPPPATAPDLTDDLILLAAFLLSSAHGLLDEPPAYGPARCADGARRALELLDAHGAPDPALTQVRKQLEDAMCGSMAEVDLPSLLRTTCDQVLDVVMARRTRTYRPPAPEAPSELNGR
ncbi:DUF6092 family protein [Streptomyces niger]|uniref:DUF6092 family protein n=1 Tax=Streptomyces niger TaxID=66373 RepID=UPI000A571238|nr:DUF6092 family protein [Streptomyces niger]